MINDFPILKVEGLTVYQGSYLAVRDVSLEIHKGTNTAIVGPNGAGKSTLVQGILDLIPRSAGSIEIFGRPIARLGNLRHQLAYTPQNFIFDRSFPISVGELVELGWVSSSCSNFFNVGGISRRKRKNPQQSRKLCAELMRTTCAIKPLELSVAVNLNVCCWHIVWLYPANSWFWMRLLLEWIFKVQQIFIRCLMNSNKKKVGRFCKSPMILIWSAITAIALFV